MDYDRIKWNSRHEAKEGFKSPDSFLIRQQPNLQKGKALDIACGRGRNSFFLSSAGFNVTAVDLSETGLLHLNEEAIRRGLDISTHQIDLDEPAPLLKHALFDTIICINFKPQLPLLQLIPQLLTNGGTFLWCSFNEEQVKITTFPVEKALHSSEFVDFFQDLQLLVYERFIDESGRRDGYLFRKIV
jgi:SAM-dependent methyltransferase